jgi:hypothetical protein
MPGVAQSVYLTDDPTQIHICPYSPICSIEKKPRILMRGFVGGWEIGGNMPSVLTGDLDLDAIGEPLARIGHHHVIR